MPTEVPGTVGGYFRSWQGTESRGARPPRAVSCRPPRTRHWEHRPARAAQWGRNALHPPPSSALLHAPLRDPPLLTISLSWPCPRGTSPASSTASTQTARHPISGAGEWCGDPRDGSTEGFGLTAFCPHPAQRRGNSGGAAGPGQAPAAGRGGERAGGRAVNRVCALGRAMRSLRCTVVFCFFVFPLL